MWMLMPILVIVLTVAADQISKALIVLYLPTEGQIIIPGVFRFTYVENEGMAFGLLSEHRWVLLILSSLGILVSITLASGLWGFMGMLFGVPLFALIVSILEDFVEYRLRKKDEPTHLYEYYPADAFIRPQDMEKKGALLSERFKVWVTSVENEVKDAPAKHPRLHRIGRRIRRMLLSVGRAIDRVSRCMTAEGKTLNADGEPISVPAHILPEEPEPLPHDPISGADILPADDTGATIGNSTFEEPSGKSDANGTDPLPETEQTAKERSTNS